MTVPDAVVIQLTSWWWARVCSKYVEDWNERIIQKNCASSWSSTRSFIEMHGQQKKKKKSWCLVKCDFSSIRCALNKCWFYRLVSFLTCFHLTGICFVQFGSSRLGSFPSWSPRFSVALLGSLIEFRSSSIQIYSHFVVRFVWILFAPIWFGLLRIFYHSVYLSDSDGHSSVWFEFDSHQLDLDQFSWFLFVQFSSFHCCQVRSGSFYLVFVYLGSFRFCFLLFSPIQRNERFVMKRSATIQMVPCLIQYWRDRWWRK